MFVVVGADGMIMTSTDAQNWTKQKSGTASTLRGITVKDDVFVAIGDDGVMLRSPDGRNWAFIQGK
jgi:photosystem II stability/assembly factor-like uncharacterized protein